MKRMSLSQGIIRSAATVRTSALLLLVVGVALGLAETSTAAWQQVAGHPMSRAALAVASALAVLVIGIIFGAFHLARRPKPVSPAAFLLALVAGGAILHVVLAVLVRPVWGTDYLRYWQHAQELVQHEKYGGFSGPYYSRALFFPYLIVRLFGPDATFALKLANIALLTGIQLFAYDILRRVHSHQAAQSASLLLFAAPLPAYATLIPSHDLWGMFFLAAASWSFTLALFTSSGMHSAPKRWIPFAVLTGVIAYMAELQRGTGVIFCLALILVALLHWLSTPSEKRARFELNQARTIVYITLIGLGAQVATNTLGDKLGLNPDSRHTLLMMKIAANSGGLGNGKSDWYARFRDRFGEKQASASGSADFARSVGLSSWVLEPVERLAHMGNQSKRLYQLSYPMDWNWMLRRPEHMSESARTQLIIYADFYGVAFGLLLIYALANLATSKRSPPPPIFALLITTLGLSLSLLLLFENKPFNIFPIWLAAALTVGYVISPVRESDPSASDPSSILSRTYSALEGAGLIAITGFLLLGALRFFYDVSRGRLLADWSYTSVQKLPPANPDWQSALLTARPQAFDAGAYNPKKLKQTYINQSKNDGDRLQKYAGSTATRMEFPAPVSQGDYLDLATHACTTTRRSLEFFLFSPSNPTGMGDSRFQLTVGIDGKDVRKIPIPLRGGNFQRFNLENSLAESKCHEVVFRLHAIRVSSGAVVPSPYIEIWMPRLIQ